VLFDIVKSTVELVLVSNIVTAVSITPETKASFNFSKVIFGAKVGFFFITVIFSFLTLPTLVLFT